MRCPVCQEETREGARFCSECGVALRHDCAGCGAALEPLDAFCTACGRSTALPTDGAGLPGSAPEAGHRQITVAFCDLVGSTGHASRLGAEDWSEVLRRFHRAAQPLVERFAGHIAQHLGDGLLVYFGYPHAHEDDAERAVRSALGIMRAVRDLNTQLEREYELELAARIGIHTGPVVIDEMGQRGRSEMLAMGTTANITARLQGVAEPGSIVISEATRQLAPGMFVTEEIGWRHLKGLAEPLRLHRVLESRAVRNRLAAARGRLTPFVGREREIGALFDRWEHVLAGEGRSVLVRGPAGIGKSRLALAFQERLVDDHTWLECRGSAHTRASPFHPTIELLERGLEISPRDTHEAKLRKLARGIEAAGFETPEALRAIARLLDLPVETPPPLGSPEALRHATIETLVAWVIASSRTRPLVLLVEDLHWLDPSSLALLGRLIEELRDNRILVLLTARPDFVPPWGEPPDSSVVAIESLRRGIARRLVVARAGSDRLSELTIERIVERADGVPIFLEELTRAALESETEGRSVAIPASLMDSLTARLDRLGPTKALAQLASVIGRTFSYRLLRSSAQLPEPVLRRGLEQLVATDLVLRDGEPPEASYTFRHALIQEAAHASLLRTRRRALHERVTRALERDFPERFASEPERVARHFDEAGLLADAILHYKRAGERCDERSASEEAIAHLTRGLELAAMLPEPERDREELALRVALGPALIAARGAGGAEVGENYHRARALCSEDASELLYILPGIYTFHLNQGELHAALDVAQEQLTLARRAREPGPLVRAHWSLGQTSCLRGDPGEAVRAFEQALAHLHPTRDRRLAHDRSDQAVSLRSWLAWASWLSGRADLAFARGDEAVELARRGGHPYSVAYGLGFDAVLHFMARERAAARERALEAAEVSQKFGFPLYLAVGRLVALWAASDRQSGRDAGEAQSADLFRQALGLLSGRGARFGMPLVSAALAEILQTAERGAEALETVRASLADAARTGIRFWDADLLRLEGELLLRETDLRRARRRLERAVVTARRQQAKLLELRASTSLARLWCARGDRDRARRLLEPIHRELSAHPETPDLRAATALLAPGRQESRHTPIRRESQRGSDR